MANIEIRRLSDEERKQLDIPDAPRRQGPWSVWECEPSVFDWHYDEMEKAYVYEGRVKVRTAVGETEIKAGDFVTFPAGLDCQWQVLETIRKVYTFE